MKGNLFKDESKQTPIEWLLEKFNNYDISTGKAGFRKLINQAKQMEEESMVEELIGFQIYLNDKGLITNHDWDFEKESKKYYKKTHGTN